MLSEGFLGRISRAMPSAKFSMTLLAFSVFGNQWITIGLKTQE